MSFLESPTFWIGISFLAVGWWLGRRKTRWGFKEVVKDPSYWKAVARDREEVNEAIRRAADWDDAQVAALVERFLFKVRTANEGWAEEKVLHSLGARSHPALLSILADKEQYDRLVKPTGVNLLPEAPFNRACDVLREAPPAEAVSVLAPFALDSSDQIRKDASIVIAAAGALEIVPLVRQAFADEEPYVGSYALMGLERALNREKLVPEVAELLFFDVQGLIEKDKNADMAVRVLPRLDQRRAAEFFLSGGTLSPESKVAHHVLQGLVDADIPVPRQRLLDLVSALDKPEISYPQTYALGQVAILLGRYGEAMDHTTLERLTNHPDSKVRQDAAEGLLSLNGLRGFKEKVWDKLDQSDFAALTDNERYFVAVYGMDGEVNNGGFSQYFVNSSGDRWEDALAGLRQMGFVERLALFEEAIQPFGADGPSHDREVRQKQLNRLYRRNDEPFSEIEDRYYKSSEEVEVLIARFVLANPNSFL